MVFPDFAALLAQYFVRLGSSGDAVPFTFMWRSMGILAMLNRLISLLLPFLSLTLQVNSHPLPLILKYRLAIHRLLLFGCRRFAHRQSEYHTSELM